MDESKIPSVLLSDVYSNDTKQMLTNLQLTTLWLFVNGDKPYNHKAALQLQSELRTQRTIRSQKHAAIKAKEREKANNQLKILCADIAEIVFAVEVFGDHNDVDGVGEILWDAKIKDKVSGAVVGSPHDLFNGATGITLAFDACGNPYTNLNDFLAELKRRYDDWQWDFSFERERKPIDRAPVATLTEPPFERKTSKYFKFALRLSWRSKLDRRTVGKIKKLIANARNQ